VSETIALCARNLGSEFDDDASTAPQQPMLFPQHPPAQPRDWGATGNSLPSAVLTDTPAVSDRWSCSVVALLP
jgi:hypothetical protein